MKKLFTLSYFVFLISYCSFAQSVGIGTNTPNASAQLDVTGTNKGMLVPRVTNSQMNAIVSPANGLLVYNTDSSAFAYRNATAWVFLKGNAIGSNNWNTLGNAGTNAATNFIGTTDNTALNFRVNNLNAGSIDPIRLNTFLGRESGNSTQTGERNVAMGFLSLADNSIGEKNTAIGVQSLISNSTGSDNTAVGYDAMFFNLSGSRNTAYGENSLGSLQDGNNNVAIGRNSLYANLSGSNNVVVGDGAGFGNTGSSNVFLGNNAGYSETGSNKLYIQNSSVGPGQALLYGEFDNKILSVGGRLGIGNTRPHAALHLPQTLENRKIILLEDVDNDHQFNGFGINTFIMRYQAAATTSSHVFYVGTSATTSTELMRITGNGEVGIGKVPFITNDDSRLQIKQKGIQNGIGVEAANSTEHWDWYVDGGVFNFNLYYNGALKGAFDNVTGAYTANSDRRLKKDITQQQPVLNNVMQLQAYKYHYLDNQPTDRFSNGFMAQDVQKIFPDAVVENTMKNGETRLGINYQYFTVLAIKGLQEQQKIIETQANNIQQQEERIAKLEAAIKTLMPKS